MTRVALLALGLASCSPVAPGTPSRQPIYVVMLPACLAICSANLGTVREQVIGSGTGGASSISQTSSQAAAAAASRQGQ